MLRSFFYIIKLLVFIALINSCSIHSKDLSKRDMNLYNTPGFEGGRPIESIMSRPDPSIVKPVGARVAPDYYYRVPPPQQVSTQSQPVSAASQNPRGGMQYPPASRFYSNPYALKPPPEYPYYDSDQYYTPPRGQGYSNDQDQVGPTQQY